jgi:hypothetical protein
VPAAIVAILAMLGVAFFTTLVVYLFFRPLHSTTC